LFIKYADARIWTVFSCFSIICRRVDYVQCGTMRCRTSACCLTRLETTLDQRPLKTSSLRPRFVVCHSSTGGYTCTVGGGELGHVTPPPERILQANYIKMNEIIFQIAGFLPGPRWGVAALPQNPTRQAQLMRRACSHAWIATLLTAECRQTSVP